MKLEKPNAILFDWDNTLVDTWPMIHIALNMTLRYMKHPEWSLDKVKKNVKKSMRDAFPEMFGSRWQEAAEHYQQSYRSIHLDTLEPLHGAKDMLQAAGKLMPLAVVSNKKGNTLRAEIAHLEWDDYFAAAVGAGDAARDKPHADPAFMVLEKMNIAPTRSVWFVGDTGVDLECAKAAGITPVLYGDHIVEGGRHDDSEFTAHVRDLKALQELILAF